MIGRLLFIFTVGSTIIGALLGRRKRAEAPGLRREMRWASEPSQPSEPADTIERVEEEARSLLDQARRRLRQALAAAREAARDTEERLKREYDEEIGKRPKTWRP
jgi:hypothetical protein